MDLGTARQRMGGVRRMAGKIGGLPSPEGAAPSVLCGSNLLSVGSYH